MDFQLFHLFTKRACMKKCYICKKYFFNSLKGTHYILLSQSVLCKRPLKFCGPCRPTPVGIRVKMLQSIFGLENSCLIGSILQECRVETETLDKKFKKLSFLTTYYSTHIHCNGINIHVYFLYNKYILY